MAYEYVIYEKVEDGIARITLNRPEVLNAFHMDMAHEIWAAADEALKDDEVAVLIYRGAGRAFSVGRDFKYSAELQKKQDPQGWRRAFTGFGEQTWFYPKITIAQVQGYAFGGGQQLAVFSDITIAAEGSQFGSPEDRYGDVRGGSHYLNFLCGPKIAKEWVLTGRTIDAADALRIGLINRVVPPEKLEEETMSYARDFVAVERKNPGFLRANKWDVIRAYPQMFFIAPTANIVKESVALREYGAKAKETQERFYAKVEREGIHAALDDLHKGFATRP